MRRHTLAAVAVCAAAGVAHAQELTSHIGPIDGQYIVTLHGHCGGAAALDAHATRLAAAHSVHPNAILHTYESINAFAVRGVGAAHALRADPCVKSVNQDEMVQFEGTEFRDLTQGESTAGGGAAAGREQQHASLRGGAGGGGRGLQAAQPTYNGVWKPPQGVQTVPHGVEWALNGRDPGDCSTLTAQLWYLDTGIQPDHPDIPSVNATASVAFQSPTLTPPWADDAGHGTWGAGMAVAANNGYGVVGVCPRASVVAVKVLDASKAGTWSNIIAGVNYVAKNAADGDVVNMSFSGGAHSDLDNAISAAVAAKRLRFSLCAGNDGRTCARRSPAQAGGIAPDFQDGIYTVAGLRVDASGTVVGPLSYSNYDSASCSGAACAVEVGAPGVFVLSTINYSRYWSDTGTSASAPMFSGVLLRAAYENQLAGKPLEHFDASYLDATAATGNGGKEYVVGESEYGRFARLAALPP